MDELVNGNLDRTAMQEVTAALHLDECWQPRDQSLLRVSSLYQCSRQQGYRIQHYVQGLPEPPLDAALLHVFDLGKALHYSLQLRLSQHGPLGWVDADPVIHERDGRKSLGWAG